MSAVETLPPIHGDPFDRILVSQALADPAPVRAERAMQVMMGMKKLDIAALDRAVEGANT